MLEFFIFIDFNSDFLVFWLSVCMIIVGRFLFIRILDCWENFKFCKILEDVFKWVDVFVFNIRFDCDFEIFDICKVLFDDNVKDFNFLIDCIVEFGNFFEFIIMVWIFVFKVCDLVFFIICWRRIDFFVVGLFFK